MAIQRLKPIQDTFIVENSSNASFGGDEILELGHCQRADATGSSRILLEFMVSEVEALIGENNNLMRATLNLKFANAENLPPVWGIDLTEIHSQWAEGNGHINDLPACTDGASWYRPKGMSKDEYWEGGILLDEPLIWKHEYFTGYQANKDLCIDVTEWVYTWMTTQDEGLGFLIKVTNEKMFDEQKSRVCFYSNESHTIFTPYLELIFDDPGDDVEIPEGTKIADPNNMVIDVKNLKESYYLGDKVRLDLSVRPEFPKRVFSTSSLYRDTGDILPEETLWGIRDEYTGEMLVNFNMYGTRIGYDGQTNYMVLNTDLLEPERYYRLLFEFDNGVTRKVYDSKNIFRVTKHGEI